MGRRGEGCPSARGPICYRTGVRSSSQRFPGREESPQTTTGPLRLLYDEECAVCRASVRLILKLAPPSSIVPVGLRSAEAATLVPDEPLEVRLQAFHVVSATGEHRKGPDALPRLLDALPGMRPVAAALRRSPVAFRGAAA
ncbi:MAG: DUF393 domain-containing protein, partial [Actinobacteria bacterium]